MENAKVEKEKGQGNGNGGKSGWIYVAIVVLIVAAAAAYVMLQKPAAAQAGENAAAAAFFAANGKMANATNYQYAFEEDAGGYANKYEVAQAEDKRQASIENVGGKWDFYQDGTGLYACGQFSNQSACAQVRKNSSVESYYFQAIAPKFINKEQVLADGKYVKALVEQGGATFADKVESSAVGGMQCDQVGYSIDYSKLSLKQLSSLGISASDPVVTQFSDYAVQMCLEKQSGIPLKISLSYKYNGEPMSYEREYAGVKIGGGAQVQKPANLESNVKLEELFRISIAEQDIYGQCAKIAKENRDACYKSQAIEKGEAGLCAKIASVQEAQKCYLMVGARGGDEGICALAGALKDDCLFEVGAGFGKVQVCNGIQNASARQECAAIAANRTAAPAQNGTQAGAGIAQNCKVDSDCAPAGCNNIACAPVGNETQVGTCGYSPVYVCYQKALCGCKAGVCNWYKGEEYNTCVSDVERMQTEEYIKSLGNWENQSSSNSTEGGQ